ncbi:MAG: hypothetical protein WD804_00545 [Gemmatimonadota bacterium]
MTPAPGRACLTLLVLLAVPGAPAASGEGPVPATYPPPFSAADTISNLAEIVQWAGPGGDPAKASEEIRAIVADREPLEATSWVHLLALLGRITPASAPLAVRAVAYADAGDEPAAVEVIVDGVDAAPEDDRGSLLALAALLSEAADPTRAAELRVRVMDEAPEAIEIPEIRLRHARWLLSIDARRAEGFRLVEDLIVDGPDHPIAPEARRLLQIERARDQGRPVLPSTSGPPVPNRR